MMLSGYLLSIVGVIILLAVVQLILPNSKIGDSVRSILGIFMLFCLISPVVDMFGGELDLKNLYTKYEVDEDFLSKLTTHGEELEEALASYLTQNYEGAKLNIQFDAKNNQVSYIFVDLSDFVIKGDEEYINYYTAIKEYLKKQIDISDERIIIYG